MPKQIRSADATFLHLSQGDHFAQFMKGFLQYLQSRLKVIPQNPSYDSPSSNYSVFRESWIGRVNSWM